MPATRYYVICHPGSIFEASHTQPESITRTWYDIPGTIYESKQKNNPTP